MATTTSNATTAFNAEAAASLKAAHTSAMAAYRKLLGERTANVAALTDASYALRALEAAHLYLTGEEITPSDNA